MMDTERYVTARLYREHCHFIGGNYYKDLSMLGRKSGNICIIDNSPKAYMLCPEQGIPIVSWYDDPNDRVLRSYIPFLILLSGVPDVRDAIESIV